MYNVIWEVAFLSTGEERFTRMQSSKHVTITQCCFNAGLWVNIETALGEWHVFADVLAQSIQQTQC